ncbi:hypothetical protein BJ875DRAFT_245707 [Amylocarpus encephaloides]|uniref:Uncharacterized protein n=1 Tax=Amylocarpus encephaloides TaxID=45428 RepID=A0A9P7YM08_9HELO|nr:hypothetical protein BJ875DRAFT_245707 [Amylocarpus encephaloides]
MSAWQKTATVLNTSILYYKHTKPLTLPGIQHLKIRHSTKHAYLQAAGRWEPGRRTLAEEWADRDGHMKRDEPLWWSCIANKTLNKAGDKRTVRSYVARKLRTAMVDSLKERGYDENGRSLVGDNRSIYGSCQITAEVDTAKMKYVDIVAQTSKIVESLEKDSRKVQSKGFYPKRSKPGQKPNQSFRRG